MYALKMVGLAVLAGACIFAFIIGYNQLQGLSASQKAREEAGNLDMKIEDVIITGNQENVEIEIPEGYTLKFEENQIKMNGIKYPASPKDEYSLPVNGPTLSQGVYTLQISLDNEVVKVRRV